MGRVADILGVGGDVDSVALLLIGRIKLEGRKDRRRELSEESFAVFQVLRFNFAILWVRKSDEVGFCIALECTNVCDSNLHFCRLSPTAADIAANWVLCTCC